MKAEEMIDGEIYHLTTGYKWLVRFKNIGKKVEKDEVKIWSYGYVDLTFGQTYNSRDYGNPVDIHKEIRPATKEEIELYERLEKKRPIINVVPLIFN